MKEAQPMNKQNVFMQFLEAWLYIFLYALKGVKYVFFDLWVDIINLFTRSSKMDVSVTNDPNKAPAKLTDMAAIYARTKSQKKNVRQYKYSEKTLAKYNAMKEKLAIDLQQAGATRSKTANIYKYTVRDISGNGKIFSATMGGFSKLDINSFLVNEGYEVYSIETSKWINFAYQETKLGGKISVKDLVFFLTQLSTYLKAGITLNEASKILANQMKNNKKMYKVLKTLNYELSLGENFSNALEKQGTFFPALLINMIKAAEASGTLQETLEEMAVYYTEVNASRKEMISALTYPAIIVIFAVAVVTFIIIYVVPQFTSIYTGMNVEITGATKFVIDLSNFLQKNLVKVIAIIVGIIILVAIAYNKIKLFRVYMQLALMKMPIFGKVIIYKEINIFAKTFASLLRNNVYITESIDILSKITSNEIYKSIMYTTVDNIVNGDKISNAFKDHWAVPDVAYYMIVTGESTGQLADMMQKVSDYYQQEHKSVVGSLKSLIEPVMIVFLAVMVGGIILATIVPMFQAYNSIM